jgi:hypothetical protein
MAAPRVPQQLPERGVRRTSPFPLFPLLAAMLLVVLALQGTRMLLELNTVTPATTPKLTSNPSVFENIQNLHPKNAVSVVNLRPQRVVVPAMASNVRVGNPQARHTLTIFTDPLCAACRVTLLKILKGLDTDRVKLVYKYWPQNPSSVEGGLIMQLAQQEGKGNALLAALSLREDTVTDIDLLGMLDVVGLNLSVQRALLAEGSVRLTDQINRDMAQAREAGLGAPPQFVLDDYVLDGRILFPARVGLYVGRLEKGEPVIQGNDYWLNSGE